MRYVNAKNSPGNLVFTEPRVEVESGERIITLAKALMIRYEYFKRNSQKKSKCFTVYRT